ncbi:MAG: TIGR02186 family protein [Pseudomonadota bacterium]
MKHHLRLFIFLVLFLFTKEACARPIISGISTNEINIDTKFTGAEVLLFGAKGDAGNIIVTIRGPRKNFSVNKKDKFLGIWYNKDRFKFKDAYSYYAFFSSKTDRMIDDKLLSQLEIGQDRIKFNVSGNDKRADESEFQVEFVDKLQQKDLYLSHPGSIEFLDETLFKVMLKFPKNISRGVYVVDIYLVDENNLVAFQSIPIYVNQVGLSAEINQFAYNNSILYGLAAVLMAVVAGFVANYIFAKLFNK